MIYFTSDLHFCHDREFLYKPRGFTSIQEHDKAIIERWNSTVGEDDDVYILGDLMLNDNQTALEYIKQLNGHKYFVRGNHDTDARMELYKDPEVGLTFVGDAYRLNYKGFHFYLSHFPTLTGNLEHEYLKQMTLNLFGHTHQKNEFFEDRPYMYNVALDAHDCYPVSAEEVILDMQHKVQECKNML